MYILYIVVIASVLVSFFLNRQKTVKAFKIGAKRLWKITPAFISVLMGVSVVLYLIPQQLISDLLGGSHAAARTLIASLVGSVMVMPGPIVYPLCRILADQGVAYNVIAAFSTTLMMVGVVTLPMEKSYFGLKFAILRNLVSYGIGLAVALVFLFVQGILL